MVIYVWECVPLRNKTDPVNYGRPVTSMIQPSYLIYNRSLRCGVVRLLKGAVTEMEVLRDDWMHS